MLEEQVVDAFLGNIKKEKDVYLPFMAMLRAQGYKKVHLLAGHYEHGKDVIAQRVNEKSQIIQYVFPIKKGDISQDKFGKLRDQLNECVDYSYAHADFDSKAFRQIVVVFPGELIGKVGEWIQHFNENTAPRLGIRPIEVWGRSKLKELFRSENCLMKLDWVQTGGFLKDILSGAGFSYIEQQTQSWATDSASSEDLWTRAVEVGILWSFLRQSDLRLHATHLTLCLLRAAIYAEAAKKISKDESFDFCSFVIKALYDDTKELLDWFAAVPSDERIIALVRVSGTELVEFNVRMTLILQTISLAVLNQSLSEVERAVAKELFELCLRVEALRKPISDNYATSVITIITAAVSLNIDVGPYLRALAQWICESYSDGNPGLASAGSMPKEEIWRTCGAPIDMKDYQPTLNSMLAAVVLDLCSILYLPDLYNDANSDFRALGIFPVRKIPANLPDELLIGKMACHVPPHHDYEESWRGEEGWINAGAHRRADEPRFFIDGRRNWVAPAISLVLRDRWWLKSLRELTSRGDVSG
ncbi:MAG: hypothetical protein KC777_30050, partial [Cyanobacteria bacterium HKST-UBA02]|nr:hypothetical protein [Cyanobacteria bacterium HKST-UBA02]